MARTPISWRTVVFATSLLAVAGAGYAFTSAAHADRSRSQDPRSWDDGKGHVDEAKVPDRIAMSSGDIHSGVVYIDPHQFYGELGATRDEGPVPVYNQREGGEQVGTYDLKTGEIAVTLDYSTHEGRPSAMSRTRTTVAASDQSTDSTAPVDSSSPSTPVDSSSPATPVDSTPPTTDSSSSTTVFSPDTVATVATVATASTMP
jgi:hypothetical protein